MAVLFVVPVLAFFGSISGVFGQFVCPTGRANKADAPKCRGDASSTCDSDRCCSDPIQCKDTMPTGNTNLAATATHRNTRCTASKIYAYNKRKNSQTNAATGTDDSTYVANCCVDCTATTCADWKQADASYNCPAGKTEITTMADPPVTPALASTSACVAPEQTVYESTCCQITCASYIGTQSVKNTLCVIETEYKYFASALVTGTMSPVVATASDSDFKSACCTSCTPMSCSNVAAAFSNLACNSGTGIQRAKVMTPALVNCAAPTETIFRAACCLQMCGTGGTATDRKTRCTANKILDSRDKSYAYPADSTDAKFITDCCRDCVTSTCGHWTRVDCVAGKSWDNAKVLAGGTDCAEPGADAKKTACCVTPMLCSAWVADASAALPTCFPFIGTLLASLAVVLGVDCL